MAQAPPHWPLALLAASLAGLLLADAALGQTFTYSRGWKPGGKRSRLPPPPPPPPRLRAAAIAASAPSASSGAAGSQLSYAEDAVLDDRQPVRYYVETLGDRWAPYEMAPWRSQLQDDADDAERYHHSEQTTRGEHDDH